MTLARALGKDQALSGQWLREAARRKAQLKKERGGTGYKSKNEEKETERQIREGLIY